MRTARTALSARRGGTVAAAKATSVETKPEHVAPSSLEALWTDAMRVFQSSRKQLLDGCVSRVVTILLLYPLDVAKCRWQLSAARSLVPSMPNLFRTPLFPGCVSSLLGNVPYSALTFGLYALFTKTAGESTPSSTPRAVTPLPMIKAALAADALGALWLTPFEAAKVRLQSGVAHSYRAAVWANARSLSALYTGFFAQLGRDLPTRVLLLVVYDAFVKSKNKADVRVGRVRHLSAQVAAAGAVGALTAPLDFVRTSVMAQRSGVAAVYQNAPHCVKRVVQSKGPVALFKGTAMRSAYMAASVAVFSLMLDVTKSTLSQRKWLWYKDEKLVDKIASGKPMQKE